MIKREIYKKIGTHASFRDKYGLKLLLAGCLKNSNSR
jgi:hypothetical protein